MTALTFDLPQEFVGVQAVDAFLPVLGQEPLHAGRLYTEASRERTRRVRGAHTERNMWIKWIYADIFGL